MVNKKLQNLFDLQERRELTVKEQKQLDNLKKIRNKICKDCINDYDDPQMCKFCNNGNKKIQPQ